MGLGCQLIHVVLFLSSLLQVVISDDVCKDTAPISACKQFAKRQYCEKGNRYYPYMKQRCAKTCKFCGEKQKDCKDNTLYQSGCSSWKKLGYCLESSQYYQHMAKHCNNTCGLCPKSIIDECKDNVLYQSGCPSWKKAGFCLESNQYYQRMAKHCKKTCGLCSTSVTNGAKTWECGKSKKRPQRVVGGKEAVPHTWPWQASLWYNNKFFCGGTLINEEWIITATHCLLGRNINGLKITLGDHHRFEDDGTEQEFDALKMITHPEYDIELQNNDIAMIKLFKKAVINKNVLPACLPKKNEEVNNLEACYITGWGKTGSREAYASILQEAKIPVVTNKVCNDHNAPFNVTYITNNMICAGYGYQTIQSGCRGDSGGPLTCNSKGKWKLQGVVSWGSSQCIGHEKYTVFTRVSKFITWIQNIIKTE